MTVLQCGTFEELFDRVKSSHQMTGWLAYLQLREEEEAEKMKAIYGEG